MIPLFLSQNKYASYFYIVCTFDFLFYIKVISPWSFVQMRRDIWAFVSSATFVTGQMSLHYLLSFKKVSLYFIREQMRSKEGKL